MKQITLLLISFLIVKNTSAQTEANTSATDPNKEIKKLQADIKTLQTESKQARTNAKTFAQDLSTAKSKIDSLETKVKGNASTISQTADKLGGQLATIEQTTGKRIDNVDQSLGKTSLYAIVGVLATLLVSVLVYLLLSKKQRSDRMDIIDQLSKTKSSIEESLVKEFGKQTELMDSQLQLIGQQKATLSSAATAQPDHSLALRVADQITSIERAISLMDEKTKGLQRIQNSVTNLKDNLSANGYEMVEMLGKPFNQGMNIIVASSVPDENLRQGEERISRIIKPQINYADKMIQAAQVEVSVG